MITKLTLTANYTTQPIRMAAVTQLALFTSHSKRSLKMHQTTGHTLTHPVYRLTDKSLSCPLSRWGYDQIMKQSNPAKILNQQWLVCYWYTTNGKCYLKIRKFTRVFNVVKFQDTMIYLQMFCGLIFRLQYVYSLNIL